MEKKVAEKRKEIYYTGSKVLLVGENRGPRESKERVYLLSAASDVLTACLLTACFTK